MRFHALALMLCLPGAGLSALVRAAEPDLYIFDALALQPYRGNFARLVKDAAVPDWVKAIAVQGAGAAGPMRTVDVAGTPYRLDRVCKVGASCATDRIDVLWAPRGARVWAALVADGKAPVMLGGPKEAQARALADAGGGSRPAAAAMPPGTAASPAAAVASTQPAPAPASAPASSAASPAPAVPSTASAGGEADAYVFDVLAVQPYKGNFARLVKAKGVPGWVKAIAAQGAGAAGPMRTVDVAGTPYRLDRVCRVGASCGSDRIDVLWAPRGARVWAALVEGGGAPTMLGEPKGPQAAALAAAGAPPAAAR